MVKMMMMASNKAISGIDHYQQLIYNNCSVFLGPSAEPRLIVSQLDSSSGTWKLHILQTNKRSGKRCPILSETAETFSRALELLHEKSAKAVEQYVAANGFDVLPAIQTRRRRQRRPRRENNSNSNSNSTQDDDDDDDDGGGGDDDEDADIIIVRSKSCSTCPSDGSDDDDKSMTGTVNSEVDSEVDEPSWKGRPTRPFIPNPGPPPPSRLPPPRMLTKPTKPPSPPHYVSPFARQAQHAAPTKRLPQPPPPPFPGPPPRDGVLDGKFLVRLHIDWSDHGVKNIIASCRPSEVAIRDRALAEVLNKPRTFLSGSHPPALPLSSPHGAASPRREKLVAILLEISLDGVGYKLSEASEDLSPLFQGGRAVPSVHVYVFDRPSLCLSSTISPWLGRRFQPIDAESDNGTTRHSSVSASSSLSSPNFN